MNKTEGKRRLTQTFEDCLFMQLHYAHRLCALIDKKDVTQGK